MKVLVACEYSGTVRDAFSAKGHDATSCDLLESETEGSHYTGDVFDILNDGWDMMIAFPPCTYLSYAATRSWYNPGRAAARIEALQFFLKLWEAPIEKICLENPQGCIDPIVAKHSQIINPYYFGDPYQKRTCLWLKNLPKLVYHRYDTLFDKQTMVKPVVEYFPGGKKKVCTDIITKGSGEVRRKERARFWPTVAEQWSQN